MGAQTSPVQCFPVLGVPERAGLRPVFAQPRPARAPGFSLVELMIAVAIIGILAAVAVPAYQLLTVRARVAEGLSLMSGLRPAISERYTATGELPANLGELGLVSDGSEPPNYAGTLTDRAAFAAAWGFTSPLWSHVEWQRKTAVCPADARCAAVVLRTEGSRLTNGVDIGLHMQVRADATGVRFRCTVNNVAARKPFVPTVCREGTVADYTSW